MRTTRRRQWSCWWCAALLMGPAIVSAVPDQAPRVSADSGQDVKLDPLCGPKSLYAVCQLLGYEATLEDFVEATQPTEQGTSLLSLFDAAESRGMKVSAHRFDGVNDLRGLSGLVVAYVNRNHFFVVEGDFVRVVDHDPFGSGLVSISDYDEMWDGECLVIERPERLGHTTDDAKGDALSGNPVS